MQFSLIFTSNIDSLFNLTVLIMRLEDFLKKIEFIELNNVNIETFMEWMKSESIWSFRF